VVVGDHATGADVTGIAGEHTGEKLAELFGVACSTGVTRPKARCAGARRRRSRT